VRSNADALAEELIAGGFAVLTGGTDTHLVQLDLRSSPWSAADLAARSAALCDKHPLYSSFSGHTLIAARPVAA
jgi:glycine/serine hydroxymethyltransferase